MSKVTAIIPSLVAVDKDYLKVCVESLRATVDWDIIVVANGTKDMNPFSGNPITGITKFFVTRDQGQCNAVNRGVDAVEGDTKWIFVINSDMYFTPQWRKNLPAFDSTTPLCFSPNLVEPSDNAGSAPPFLKLNGGNDLEAFKRNEVNNFINKEQDKHHEMTDGFNLPFFMRLDVWRTIGGYDQKYDPWGSNSDTDLQTKVNLAGIVPKRLLDVLVYHFSNKSGTFDRSVEEKNQAWWNNFNYYRDKFGFDRDELKSDVWMNENMLPEDPERIKYRPEWMGKYLES